jgi:WXG100 family type VII secretion target
MPRPIWQDFEDWKRKEGEVNRPAHSVTKGAVAAVSKGGGPMTIRVEQGAHAAAAQKTRANAADLQATLDRVRKDVAELAGQWQGQAQAAAISLHAELDAIGIRAQQAFDAFGAKVGIAGVNYEENEAATTRLFS